MWNETLKDRCLYLRSLSDIRLLPNCYVMLMLDGRAFSKFCKQFEKPYSDEFISLMNETALFLCSQIEGCRFAYTQSDEISILIKQDDTSDLWFGNRISKLCSITASLASSKFTKLLVSNLIKKATNKDEIQDAIEKLSIVSFDCKAWNIPTLNDVYSWFIYRQRDCIRNSKQMLSQFYFTHKEIEGVNCETQIEMVKEKFGVDWNELPNNKKFGRFLYRQEVEIQVPNSEEVILRKKWRCNDAFQLTFENKFDFKKLIDL